jgi:hypothetical protein
MWEGGILFTLVETYKLTRLRVITLVRITKLHELYLRKVYMTKRKGHWEKGKSANPAGRPRGQNSIWAFLADPAGFECRHLRWHKFCWEYMIWPLNQAKAARNAGYSHKSARFIASRLLKKTVIQAMLQRYSAMVYLHERTRDWEYSHTGDVVEKRRQMEERIRKLRESLR